MHSVSQHPAFSELTLRLMLPDRMHYMPSLNAFYLPIDTILSANIMHFLANDCIRWGH